MRDNVILWWILTAFFALVGVVYTGWHILATPNENFAMRIEWVGTVGMALTGVLSFFSTTTVFGTPVDVTLSELAIEAFFPADPQTGEALRKFAETRASSNVSSD